MDATHSVAHEAENENVGIVDRIVGCLQPVLTILGKAAPKEHKLGIPNTHCSMLTVTEFLCLFVFKSMCCVCDFCKYLLFV